MPRPILIAALILLAGLTAFRSSQTLFTLGPADTGGEYLDFGSFMHSAAALRAGLDPYEYHPQIEPEPYGPDALNRNPPISLVAFSALERLPTEKALYGLRVASICAFAAAILLTRRAHPETFSLLAVMVVLASDLVWWAVWLGQVYFFLALFSAGAWLALKRSRPVLAGVLIGVLAAVKPPFLLWPLLLFCSGKRKASAWAMGSFGLLSVLPMMIYGLDVYESWVRLILAERQFASWPEAELSLAALTNTVIGEPLLGLILAGVLALGAALWSFVAKPCVEQVSAVALGLALLISPVTWLGYFVIFLPALFVYPLNATTWAGLWLLIPVRMTAGLGFLVILAGIALAWRRQLTKAGPPEHEDAAALLVTAALRPSAEQRL